MNITVVPIYKAVSASHQAIDYLSKICDWESKAYGEGLHRTPDVLAACIEKNPEGFLVALQNSKLVGYADIWQLNADFYQNLKVGRIEEESLQSNHILESGQKNTNDWYIGSMITNPEIREISSYTSAGIFSALCNSLPDFFIRKCEFPFRLLGVGSSATGVRLLQRWKFSPVKKATDAIDVRPRYEKHIKFSEDADIFRLKRYRNCLSDVP